MLNSFLLCAGKKLLRVAPVLVMAALALFAARPASADTAQVSLCEGNCIQGTTIQGTTSVTFTVLSPLEVQVYVTGFVVGLYGPTPDVLYDQQLDLFLGGGAAGGGTYGFDGYPASFINGDSSFTSWTLSGTPGNMTLTFSGDALECGGLCDINAGPPDVTDVTLTITEANITVPTGATPEPSSLLLLGTGLLGLGPLIRRRLA